MQVALTGHDKPSRAVLEQQTVELETELLHMHTQCGQLKVQLATHADECRSVHTSMHAAQHYQLLMLSNDAGPERVWDFFDLQ
jgi:hypothetical protein